MNTISTSTVTLEPGLHFKTWVLMLEKLKKLFLYPILIVNNDITEAIIKFTENYCSICKPQTGNLLTMMQNHDYIIWSQICSLSVDWVVWGPDLIARGQIKRARIRSGDSCSISVCSSGMWPEPMKCISYVRWFLTQWNASIASVEFGLQPMEFGYSQWNESIATSTPSL